MLLLLRGDEWETGTIAWNLSGNLTPGNAPMVMGSYGDPAEPRPRIISQLTPHAATGLRIFRNDPETGGNIVFRDLHLVGDGTHMADAVGILLMGNWTNVLFENCRVEGYRLNFYTEQSVYQAPNQPPVYLRPSNIALRRSAILDAYTPYPGPHAIGILTQATDGLLIEECIFDKNGWSDTRRVHLETRSNSTAQEVYVPGRAWDEYGVGLTLEVTSGPAQGQSRSVVAAYGTDGRTPDLVLTGQLRQIRLADSASSQNGFYNGATIRWTFTANTTRTISSYDGSTKIATVGDDWPVEVPGKTYYTIEGDKVPALVLASPLTTSVGAADVELYGFFGTDKRHNTYIHESCTDIVMRGNISARSSANGLQLRPGGLIDANLVLENPLGITVGHGSLQAGGTVRNNSVIGSRDIHLGPPRGQGMFFDGLQYFDVYGNLIAHSGDLSTDSIFGIEFFHNQSSMPVDFVRLFHNRIYNWYNIAESKGSCFHFAQNQTYSDVWLAWNQLQQPDGGHIVPGNNQCHTGWGLTWVENLYWSLESGLSNWVANCALEDPGQIEEVEYPFPERDIGAYMTYLGLSGGVEEFMAHAREMQHGDWDENFTATAVLNYLRKGFELPALPKRDRRTFHKIDPATGESELIELDIMVWIWMMSDFGGIDIDANGDMYAVSTRERPTDFRPALYRLTNGLTPTFLAHIDIREMEGLAAGDVELYVVTGEDKSIRRYSKTNGTLLGTIPLPLDFDIGGTFAGAGFYEIVIPANSMGPP
jgi:hypothetical protein